MEITKHKSWTWKDLVISWMYGRGIEIVFEDGTVWKGARVLADEIQQLLDSITTTPGAILSPPCLAAGAHSYQAPPMKCSPVNGPSALPDYDAAQAAGVVGGCLATPPVLRGTPVSHHAHRPVIRPFECDERRPALPLRHRSLSGATYKAGSSRNSTAVLKFTSSRRQPRADSNKQAAARDSKFPPCQAASCSTRTAYMLHCTLAQTAQTSYSSGRTAATK